MLDYCDNCGRDADGCVCRLAPDFPDEPDLEIDTDYLDWDFDADEDEIQEELKELDRLTKEERHENCG